ncbi:hypothetical protein [Streptomyces sp. NRRL S-1868]|uniref:hypothetical protein n=1 Tax=Streptomyces sp. NRRL S-1868 TaxID=1463892 RepID=UPI0004C5BA5E|nr:hypothetical protein [Streptomyces sp. NRRL S-1868]
MALRKPTMKKQVAEAIAGQMPGDRPLVTVAAVAGPTPWLSVGLLALIGQLLTKYYFITVTEQGLLLHRMARFSQRPKEIVHAIPRDQAAALFGEIQLNPLWSVFHMMLPGGAKPVRINIHRMWRNELQEMIQLLRGGFPGPVPGAPSQMPYPAPQGYAPPAAPAPAPGYAPPPQGYAPQQGYAPPQGYGPPQGAVPPQPGQPGQAQPPQPPQYGGHYGAPAPQHPPQPPQGNPYA